VLTNSDLLLAREEIGARTKKILSQNTSAAETGRRFPNGKSAIDRTLIQITNVPMPRPHRKNRDEAFVRGHDRTTIQPLSNALKAFRGFNYQRT